MNIVVAFGTRPEAIKLAPVIRDLRERPTLHVQVVTTAQHREMLDQVLDLFKIVPDRDLAIMQPRQTLASLSGRVLAAMEELLTADKPDLVIVQGDTTSALMCALAAFYGGIPVAHVEAGLRTDSPVNPFPEEMNRRLTSVLTSTHFAPTERARRRLLAEGVPEDAVFVTGNTVVDALLQIRASSAYKTARLPPTVAADGRILLVTLHRRESWGAPLAAMCRALRTIVEARPDVQLVLPVHLNPVVRQDIRQGLEGIPRVAIVEPLHYLEFIKLMEASWLVLTDSGGVQEEAPTLGRPVLVLRDTTERPEAVEQGAAYLVGTDPDAIVRAALAVLDDPAKHAAMARPISPFGDGHAARRIGDIVEVRRNAILAQSWARVATK